MLNILHEKGNFHFALLLIINIHCYNQCITLEEMCMISKIGVEDNKQNIVLLNNSKGSQNPNFRGGLWDASLGLIQACERNPMINVAVIDMLSAILPRTFVESLTNVFAGFEAFRRESSGLIFNCLIPSAITFVCALGLNKFIMPKGINMASCWSDTKLIDRTKEIYENSTSKDKVADTFKELIKNIEGVDGKNKVKFNDSKVLSEAEIEEYANKLRELSEKNLKSKELKKEIEKISMEIAQKTHIYERITVAGEKEVKANTVTTLLHDSVKFFHEFGKAAKNDAKLGIAEFAQKSKKLVGTKSAAGLMIVLPLAASMQFINRWITAKVSGFKGAPIYEDFGKETNKEQEVNDKKGLLKQKIISISSMITVGLLSMMKKPTWNMLEFKGMFPTMDQARIISTTTFASRMAAAEDKNELRESTIRDICTFLSLYFLGDYAAKAAATIIQKKNPDLVLLNDTKPIEKDANIFKKFWHWFKDVNIKSNEEVVNKKAEALKAKGSLITDAEKKVLENELKRSRNMRSACQIANIGVSLVLLGLVIPIFTRKSTKKKHAEEMKLVQLQTSSSGNATKVGA